MGEITEPVLEEFETCCEISVVSNSIKLIPEDSDTSCGLRGSVKFKPIVLGDSVNLDITLKETTLVPTPSGKIACESTPSDALILLGKVILGQPVMYVNQNVRTNPDKPVILSGIEPGDYRVMFAKDGYTSCTTAITVYWGGVAYAHCALDPVQATGALSCTTTPIGAKVYLDGALESVGVTPLIIEELLPGIHTVVFKKDGFPDCLKQQAVVVGQTREVFCELELPPLPEGYIKCQAYDSVTNAGLTATIRIDNQTVAPLTPHTTPGLPPGEHTVTFIHEGYITTTVTVTVVAGETVNAYGSMVKKELPVGPGFDIDVDIPSLAPGDNLYVVKVLKVPFTNTWIVSDIIIPVPITGMIWNNIENGLFAARVAPADCEPMPSHFKNFEIGKHYAVYVGTKALTFYPETRVHLLTDMTTSIEITDSIMSWLERTICGFFDITPANCPFFLATFYDPIFVAELLEIIIHNRNLAGEYQEPTTLDYVMLPIAVAGSVLPMIPAGKLGKYTGLLIKRCKESTPIKEIFETRGVDIVEMSIRGSTAQIDTFMEAVKSGDTIKMLHTIDEVLKAPPTTIGHEWEWLSNVKKISDETHKLVEKSGALVPAPIKNVITSVHSKMLSKAINKPPLYRFAKESDIEIITNLFDAAYQNAIRRESLTSTELASISQLAHNNPELFAKRLAAMLDSGFTLFKKALKDSGGFSEADLVEYARAIAKEGVLDNRGFNILSRMLAKQPMAKLAGSEDEIAEAFIKEFPTLSGERVIAELSLMPEDFLKRHPGVKTAAVDRLKVTKKFSDWEAVSAVEGKICQTVVHYIKRVPGEASKHPIMLIGMTIAGTFSYIGMGIAPMWFIEETPQTFSIPIFSAIKEKKYDEARAMMPAYKLYLDDLDSSIVPWTKTWFFLWAPFVDMAMIAHHNQYDAYALLLGMSTKPPDVPEVFNARITDVIDADSMYIGVPKDEINEETGWRVVIERWKDVKVSEGFNENSTPDIPLNYEIRLTGVNAPEAAAENYLVRRLTCPTCEEERWNATKGIYNNANDWAHQKMWHKLVELHTDQSDLLDKYNRILVVVYDNTDNINAGLLKNGHTVVFFYSANNKVDESLFLSNETIARNGRIGVWAIAVDSGTIRCVSHPTSAEVWLDGINTGKKTISNVAYLEGVAIGSHTITFKKIIEETPQSCSKDVTVIKDITVDAECTLSGFVPPPPEGKIHCKTLKPAGTSLSGAKIYLTGVGYENQYMGDTEKTITVPVGTYSIKYTYPEYLDGLVENITVTEGVLSDATCSMEPSLIPVDKATWYIGDVKNEAGEILSAAEVYVDGEYTHHWAPETLTFCSGCECDTIIPCDFGTHTVTIKKTGYEDWTETRTLVAGDTPTDSPVMQLIGVVKFPVTIESVPAGAVIEIDGTVI